MADTVASPTAVQYLRLRTARGVGPVSFSRLLERFGSPEAVLDAPRDALQTVNGIGPTTADAIRQAETSEEYRHELELAAEHGVRILCRQDAGYPKPLLHIPDAPICLYIKGEMTPTDAVAVAIVGSRRCTQYGREVARRFGYGLAQRGVTIVSGLARGIDAAGHWGAVEADGRTIAVLGNGLARVYPPEHQELAARIIDGHGAILSELPMETAPDADNFLPRNRIIAGLTMGTIVVEAARRSGALSTARQAADYNREVFAVPGRIDSVASEGTNAAIRDQHAKLVTNVKDVLDELGEAGACLLDAEEHAPPAVTPDAALRRDEERIVYGAFDGEVLSIDQLAAITELPTGTVASVLVQLQLKGLVRQQAGGLFTRAGKGP